MNQIHKTRFITSLILITVVTLILFSKFIIFNLIAFIICMLSTLEWCNFNNLNQYNKKIMLFTFLILSILVSFKQEIIICKYITLLSFTWWQIACLLNFHYPYSIKLFNRFEILKVIAGILIIIPLFNSLIIIYQYKNLKIFDNGQNLLLYIFFTVCLIDTSAYIIGNILGKSKIFPLISPNKTVEGVIGSFLIGLIVIVIMQILINQTNFIYLTFFFIIMFFSSILGDLTESMFKRNANIKDSSNIIPGHGGILDRIDSLTATIPIFHFLVILKDNLFFQL